MTNLTNRTIIINNSKRTIEISKTFSKLASVYNSKEYRDLKGAKLDNPNYRVVVKSPAKRKIEDRITMKDIITYVEAKSGVESTEMNALKELRGKSIKEAGNLLDVEETATFSDIKKWFFATYPEIANKTRARQNHINAILAEAASNAVSA